MRDGRSIVVRLSGLKLASYFLSILHVVPKEKAIRMVDYSWLFSLFCRRLSVGMEDLRRVHDVVLFFFSFFSLFFSG